MWGTFIFLVFAGAIVVATGVRRVMLMEYERGVCYFQGRYYRVVGPGVHWYFPYYTRLKRVDVRPQVVTIAGQEVLSADGVALKVSLIASYEIADPATAVNKVKDYAEALYAQLQVGVRRIIGGYDVDALLGQRDSLATKLLELSAPLATELGLRLIFVDVKDIMVPGKLKEMFAQVVAARKAGQAALEKARGETAALRHLANAARLVDDQPNLLQLRLLHAMTESSGNTIVLGLPSQAPVIPVRAAETGSAKKMPPPTKGATEE